MFDLQEILVQIGMELAEFDDSIVWDEPPPTLEDLLSAVGEQLTSKQAEILETFFGNDPEKIFFNGKNYAFLALGKGSGKDFMAVRLVVWAVAVLYCMHDPRKFFNLSSDSTIDIINVSKTNDQAGNIFFARFIKYIKMHPWFRSRFTILDGHGYYTKKGKDELKIVDSKKMIEIKSKGILAISANAQYGNYEGYSPIIAVIDELGNFYRAPEGSKSPQDGISVFDTLETSAKTRYVDKFKMIAISWIRSEDDCMVYLMEQYRNRKDTVIYELPSWEVRPELYSDKKVPFEYQNKTYYIPENILADMKRNTDVKLRMYGSFRLKSIDNFFGGVSFEGLKNKEWLLKADDYWTTGGRVKKRIYEWNKKYKNYPLIIHVDLGEVNCMSVMSVGYGWVEDNVRGLVVLNSMAWVPEGEYIVSINNVLSVILKIAEFGNLVYVQYDDWNSSTSVETLEDNRINAGKHTVSRLDYQVLRNAMRDKKIMIGSVDYDLDKQLDGIKDTGSKIEKKKGYFKDGLDTLAGLMYLVRTLPRNQLLNVQNPTKGIISKQIHKEDAMEEFLDRYGAL